MKRYIQILTQSLLLLVFFVQPVLAQEDTYHSTLRSELATAHNLTGGTWVFSGMESTTMVPTYASSGVTVQAVTPGGQPFTQGLRLETTQAMNEPWENSVFFEPQTSLNQGDAALLVFWIRHVGTGDGEVVLSFGATEAPWTTSLDETIYPDGQWRQWLVPFEAAIAHPTGQASFAFMLGARAQTIEIGGLAMINYGTAYTVAQLPRTTPPDDAYHAGLMAQLTTTHGLTGGSWVFSNSENVTSSLVYSSSGVTVQPMAVTGQYFTQGFRLETAAAANPWDHSVFFAPQTSLNQGDAALLVVWVRGIAAQLGTGEITHVFQETADPWTTSLHQIQHPGSDWQQWFIPFEAAADHPAGQAIYSIHLGAQAQTIEIGGLAMINYGTAYTVAQLPRTTPPDDAYHVSLRDQLANTYGLTGGTFVFGNTEASKISGDYVSPEITANLVAVSGQPFTLAHRLATDQANDFWLRSFNLGTNADVAVGDRMLLVVWLRSLSAARHEGHVTISYQEGAPPDYTQSLAEQRSLTSEWRQGFFPFEAATSNLVGEAIFSLLLGHMQQTVEIGGLALINYGTAYTLNQLPTSAWNLDYVGREPGAAWRADAQARIAQHRQGPMAVRVVDSNGQPVENADVAVAMQRHAFHFGTALHLARLMGTSPADETYRQQIFNLTGDGRGFNLAVPEFGLRWLPWEDRWFPVPEEDFPAVLDTLANHGLDIKGHALFYAIDGQLPSGLENEPASVIRQTSLDHVTEEADSLAGHIYAWDVIVEVLTQSHITDIFDADPSAPSGVEFYRDLFTTAKAADPNARLIISEAGILMDAGVNYVAQEGLHTLLQNLFALGAPVEGIGMQSHMGYPLTPPETIYEILNEYAGYGIDLTISEFDALDVDEALVADYLRDFMTVVFSHPSATQFIIFGPEDGSHWLGDAPFFRADGSAKPALAAYTDLVFNQWWTNGSGPSDAAGLFETPAFYGDYEITVTHGGTSQTLAYTLTQGVQDTLEVVVPASQGASRSSTLNPANQAETTAALPDGFELTGAYPNPFNPETAFSLTLAEPQEVRIAVYDVLGRQVALLHQGPLAAQQAHNFRFQGGTYPSGVYFVQAAGERFSAVRQMSLLK